EHREADRVPVYVWLFATDATKPVEEKYGSVDAYLDHVGVDVYQTFPQGAPIDKEAALAQRGAGEEGPTDPTYGQVLTIQEALDAPLTDPDDQSIYAPVRRDVAHHKQQRGRAIFCQTPGVFECANGYLGIQASLEYMATEPEKMLALFRRIATWAKSYVDNCLELGVDVVHISDDWGENQRLMFSPRMFRELIVPAERIHASHAKARGAYLSLHCDGYFASVLDDVVDLGFDCVHPVQESAGMDLAQFKKEYGDKLCMYGGLDVRALLGRGDLDHLRAEITRVMQTMKPGGGFIFCTSHTVPDYCSLEELELAYEVALEVGRY
ncbi:MAG: uroporphyrinogen decarboxylase family protein, partial [Armatimonadota bacterium]